jgi:uncharacterized protein (TIGR02594 family)
MATPKEYRVTAHALHVREEPSIAAAVVGYLHKGDIVQRVTVSPDDYWLKVKKGLLEGWSAQKYLAPVAPSAAPAEEFPWMPIALGEQGVKESPGTGDNPRVVEYLKSTNLGTPHNANDETPWCSAFVNWCIERAGYEGTDSAWARAWLNWGKPVAMPKRGCIVVLSRGASSGHVGFYIGERGDSIKVLSGNQRDAVNISAYPKVRVLGYRLPG